MADLSKFIETPEQADKAFCYIMAMKYYYSKDMTLEEAEFYADILFIFQ